MKNRPDMRDLMSSVGFLLLYWGLLEKGLKGGPFPADAEAARQKVQQPVPWEQVKVELGLS